MPYADPDRQREANKLNMRKRRTDPSKRGQDNARQRARYARFPMKEWPADRREARAAYRKQWDAEHREQINENARKRYALKSKGIT